MKKKTVIFGAIFVALLSYVLLVEKKNFSKFEPPSRQGPKLFSIKQEDLQYFRLQNANSIIAFRKNDSGEWRMEKPLIDQADPIQCENLARSVANVTLLGTIDKKESLKDYGFDKVAIRLHIEGKGTAPIDMEFGAEDPTNKGIYAYLTNDQRIVLLPNFIKQIAEKPLGEWRDPAPVHLDQDKITACSFKSPNGSISLKKIDDNWKLTEPVSEEADAEKVQQVLITFSSIRGMSFVPLAQAKSFSPFATLTLTEKDKTPSVITIQKKGKDYLVLPPDRAYGVLTTDQFLKEISFKPAHYLDLHLVRFQDRLITKVEVVKKGKLFLFDKNGSDWTLVEPQETRIPPWKAVSILSDLRSIKIDPLSKLPSSFHATVSLKLWKGKTFVGAVYIGDRIKVGKKDLYPARVTPSKRAGMIDAAPLFHDLP